MERPKRIGGRDPIYTRKALAARIEGTALVQCVITTEGATRDCKMIKGLQFMDDEILAAAATWRFTPVMFRGRAVNVQYVMPVKLSLGHAAPPTSGPTVPAGNTQ